MDTREPGEYARTDISLPEVERQLEAEVVKAAQEWRRALLAYDAATDSTWGVQAVQVVAARRALNDALDALEAAE